MELAFSTLGCPDWDLDTVLAKAVAFGYAGVEVRGIGGNLDVSAMPEFDVGIAETAARFADAGIELTCFDTSVRAVTTSEEQHRAGLDEIRRYSRMCPYFKTPYLRVFGGSFEGMSREEAITVAGRNLREAADLAGEGGSRILVETHDEWLTAPDVAALLDAANDVRVGVLWDTHHTYRVGGESPGQTWQVLGERVLGTHLKDSLRDPDGDDMCAYCLPGEGDIPLKDIVTCLRTAGYTGYLTFEWEKRWHPELPEPDIALPRYVESFRGMLGSTLI